MDCLVSQSTTTRMVLKPEDGGEFINEVHGDGIPWVFWDWELLQESIGAMSLRLQAHTSGTGFDIGLNRVPEFQPDIVTSD